jgi:hypothetical protein
MDELVGVGDEVDGGCELVRAEDCGGIRFESLCASCVTLRLLLCSLVVLAHSLQTLSATSTSSSNSYPRPPTPVVSARSLNNTEC